jgi:tetratricopeptide (TPR) repeat protein
MQQDWEALIETGNDALDKGFDFYYLRYRLGIAYYQQQNYHRAARHFRKAFDMNDRDDLLKEYLYYSYLLAGRRYEAYYTEQLFTNRTRQKLNLGVDRPFKNVSITWGSQPGAQSSVTEAFNSSTGSNGYQTVSTGYHLFQIGAEHRAGSRNWLSHTYTHLQKSYFLFSNTDGLPVIDPDETVYLNQYYIGSTTLLKPGLDLRLGVHYINLLNYVTTVTPPPRPRTVRTSVTNSDFVGSAAINWRFSYAETGFSSSISNLNSATQLQQNAYLSLFPFGNLKLYTTSVLHYQSEKAGTGSLSRSNTTIFTQRAGAQMINRVWAEAFISFGDQLNVVTDNGQTVFNDTDIITSRFGVRMHALITNRLNLILGYNQMEKESRFTPDGSETDLPDPVTYNTQNLTVTILWAM